MKCGGIGQIGVCSWSLKNDLVLLNQLRDNVGIEYVHLSINPELDGQTGCARQFLEAGWKLSAAMVGFAQEDYSMPASIRQTGGIVPDAFWSQNKERVIKAIHITHLLGAPYLEFHFGFIDIADRRAFEQLAQKTLELAEIAAKHNVTLLMETGQETALVLRKFIEYVNHPALAINFDPANMLLYGQGNPIEAIEILSPWIRHIHIKDAIAPQTPGQWGKEVAWGTGQVNPELFLKALRQVSYVGIMSIEREAGDKRLQDIESAIGQIVSWRQSNA